MSDLNWKQTSEEFNGRQQALAAAAGAACQRSLRCMTDAVAYTEATTRRGEGVTMAVGQS